MGIEGATVVTVLRHGAVEGRPFIYRGRQDDPLSELGWSQMEAATRATVGADRVRDIDAGYRGHGPLLQVASSPLQRCQVFARHLAERHGVPLRLSPAFQEIAFGDWEGLTPEEAALLNPVEHQLFRSSAGKVAAPGGENLMELRDRVRAGWEAWLADARGGRYLLVTHAGVMRALLTELIGLPASHVYRIALPEAAHFQISLLAGEAPILLSLNACAA
ncbi:MAG: histidine phosphatase family protein [Pseudomonadota bacterium]|nr:histidine phosphatase family protein [Pseudomonadota bacterium]MDP1903078.1 histidine phosphatase family protein [Pseudomonadota bacterium]MDP2353068.1 histidine phosphatase family protein [Pseudomonadota bacterium]